MGWPSLVMVILMPRPTSLNSYGKELSASTSVIVLVLVSIQRDGRWIGSISLPPLDIVVRR